MDLNTPHSNRANASEASATAQDDHAHDKALLQLFAHQDAVLAVGAFMAVPVAHVEWYALFLLFPLHFVIRLYEYRRLDGAEEQYLRTNISIPKRTYLRIHAAHDCRTISYPFGKIILMPQNFPRQIDEKHNRAILYHEIGHCMQGDWLVIIMYVFSIVAGIVALLMYLFPEFSTELVYGEKEPADTFDMPQKALFIGWLVLLAAPVIGFYRVIHRREFLADSFALEHSRDDLLKFLQNRANRARHSVPKSYLSKVTNRITHPTFSERLSFQNGKHRLSYQDMFVSSAAFSLFLCFFSISLAGKVVFLGSIAIILAGLIFLAGLCLIALSFRYIRTQLVAWQYRVSMVLGYATGLVILPSLFFLGALPFVSFSEKELDFLPALIFGGAFAWIGLVYVFEQIFYRMGSGIVAIGLFGLLIIPGAYFLGGLSVSMIVFNDFEGTFFIVSRFFLYALVVFVASYCADFALRFAVRKLTSLTQGR
ncbi:MAG: M48 family metalloprotease [Pseudomonadota bacterium]